LKKKKGDEIRKRKEEDSRIFIAVQT